MQFNATKAHQHCMVLTPLKPILTCARTWWITWFLDPPLPCLQVPLHQTRFYISAVVYDSALMGGFGPVIADVPSTPYISGSTVSTLFNGANPRNNLRLEGTTHLTVDRLVDSVWTPIRSDSHPSTTFQMESNGCSCASYKVWTSVANRGKSSITY